MISKKPPDHDDTVKDMEGEDSVKATIGERYYTVKEAAALLKVERHTISAMKHAGKLRVLPVGAGGRSYRIAESALKDLERTMTPPQPYQWRRAAVKGR